MNSSWVVRLIIVNVVMFFLTAIGPELVTLLMFVPLRLVSAPWTIVTYMFLHDGVFHLAFNMLGLYFFGQALESQLGGRDFLILYFVSGVTGALLSFITPAVAIVGASGAVYGVLLGFARYWPHERIMIWGIIPIEARTLVIGMTVLSMIGGFSGSGNIAHFAHLGGFVGGYIVLVFHDRASRSRREAFAPEPVRGPSGADLRAWLAIDRDRLHEVNRDEYDRIVDKIRREGPERLTEQEITFLRRFSEQLS